MIAILKEEFFLCARDKIITIKSGRHPYWEKNRPIRIGIGGPVGSGKTALVERLAKRMKDRYSVAVITNDIYTKEDAEILIRSEALPAERIIGVETGGCPHTAIREDASMNFEAVEELEERFEDLQLIFLSRVEETIWRPRSPRSWSIVLFILSMSPRARKFRAKAVPALCVRTC